MDQQRISPRRRSLMLGAAAAAAGAAALTHPLSVLAQGAEEIVIGGSIPMTGVFAFAGVGINAGIQDYVKIVNDCLLYTSPSPRDKRQSRMPSSA